MAQTQPELKKPVLRLPTIIPKKVLVTVLYPDRQLMLEAKMSKDGNSIDCKNLGVFTVPKDYRPKITWYKGKTMLNYYFDAYGNAIEIKDTGDAKIVAPDPQFRKMLIDRGLIAKIFRVGMDWSQVIVGVGLGMFAFALILFFVLPLLGVPVHIGKSAIEVITQTPAAVPLPGNYTFPPPP